MAKKTPLLAAVASDLVGAVAACAPTFAEWQVEINKIAESEGLTPKENPLPGELDTWRKQYESGKSPRQAWNAVPYRHRDNPFV